MYSLTKNLRFQLYENRKQKFYITSTYNIFNSNINYKQLNLRCAWSPKREIYLRYSKYKCQNHENRK